MAARAPTARCITTLPSRGGLLVALIWTWAVDVAAVLPSSMHEEVTRWWLPGQPLNSTQVVKIGVAFTLSQVRDVEIMGKAMQRGLELYFNFLHMSQGGLSLQGVAHAVEVTLVDDQANVDFVVPIIEHLIHTRGVELLFGPYGSLSEQAVLAAQRSGALLLESAAADASIFRDHPRVFGTLSPAAQTLQPAVDLVVPLGAKSFAVLTEGTPLMQEECGAMQGLAQRHGLNILFSWTVQHDAPEDLVRSAAARMQEATPDVVVGCVHEVVCHRLLQSLQVLDFNPKAVILTSCVTASGFLQQAGSAGQYIIGTVPWASGLPLSSDLTPWNASTFSEHYSAMFDDKREPPYQAALTFAMCEALVFAIEQAGSTEPAAVARALSAMEKQSIFGRMAFDEHGQNLNQAKVVQFQDSLEYRVVAPPASAEFSVVYPKPTWTHLRCSETSKYLRYGFVVDPLTQASVCQVCPSGKIGMYHRASQMRFCEDCSAGHSVQTYPDRQDETFCEPCPTGHYSVVAGFTSECLACPMGRFQGLVGQTTCEACPPGRAGGVAGSMRCESCEERPAPHGVVTFAPGFGQERCRPCPEHGLCEKDAHGLLSSYTNLEGYFVLCQQCENESSSLFACPHGDGAACRARGECLKDPTTGELAMDGPLCGRCTKGFGRFDWLYGICEACPSVGRAFFGFLLNVILINFIVGCMALTTLFKDFSKPTHIHSAILKQFLNYLQMTAVAFSATEFDIVFNFSVRDTVRLLLSIFGLTSTALGDMSTWCLSNYFLPDIEVYKVMTITGLLWAPFWSMLDVLLYGIVRLLCLCFRWRPPRTQFLKAFMTMKIFLSLTRLTELCLLPFGCYYVDTARLLMDTSIDCTSSAHWIWQMIGLVGFICFSLGIPFMFFLILFHYKRQGRLQERDTQAVFGFLFNGLEPSLYYFECVFMLRKVLFLFLIHLPGQSEVSEKIACFSLTFVSGFFLMLHMWCRPYDNRAYFLLDETEGASLMAVFLTLVAQIALWSTQDSLVFKLHPTYKTICTSIVFAVVTLLHLRFLTLAFWGIMRRGIIDCCFRGLPPRWLFKGSVGVTNEGLQLQGLSRSALQLLQSLFGEVVGICASMTGGIQYEVLQQALERLCINANYAAKKRKYIQLDPLRQHTKFLSQKASLLPVGSQYAKEAIEAVDTFRRSLQRKSSVPDGDGEMQEALDMGYYMNRGGSLGQKIEELAEFSEANRLRTLGARFTVEDLHEALLLLGKDVCTGGERSSVRTAESERSSSMSALPCLGPGEAMAAEFRVLKRQCDEYRRLAEEAAQESQRLHSELVDAQQCSRKCQWSGPEESESRNSKAMPPDLNIKVPEPLQNTAAEHCDRADIGQIMSEPSLGPVGRNCRKIKRVSMSSCTEDTSVPADTPNELPSSTAVVVVVGEDGPLPTPSPQIGSLAAMEEERTVETTAWQSAAKSDLESNAVPAGGEAGSDSVGAAVACAVQKDKPWRAQSGDCSESEESLQGEHCPQHDDVNSYLAAWLTDSAVPDAPTADLDYWRPAVDDSRFAEELMKADLAWERTFLHNAACVQEDSDPRWQSL